MEKLNVDCLQLIFDELKGEDNYSRILYSCLLVNKKWCNVVVPILWRECSFNRIWTANEKIYSTMLSCLPPSSKQLLFDNDIKLPSTVLKSPLFNYISFCEFPDADIVYSIVEMVLEKKPSSTLKPNNNNKKDLLEQQIYKLFVSQFNNIRELYWQTSQPLSLFPGASSCFSQLYSLYVDVEIVNSNALYEMAQICKDLSELTVNNCPEDLSGLISFIDAQRNLKSVRFNYRCKRKS